MSTASRLSQSAPESDQKVTRKGVADSVATLLRNLDVPSALSATAALRGLDSQHVRQLIQLAVARLPERWQAIILRCEIGRELHAVVAFELGISKRHFYRERRRALARMGELLDDVDLPVHTSEVTEIDPEQAVIAAVNALTYTNRVSTAISVLQSAIGATASQSARVRLALRLSGMYGQAERPREAMEAAQMAQSMAAAMDPTPITIRLEIAVAEAYALRYQQHWERAKGRLASAVTCTSLPFDHKQHREVSTALADARLALAHLHMVTDEYGKGLPLATLAVAAVRQLDVHAALRSRALTQLASMRFFAGTPTAAVLPDLLEAFDVSQGNGFVHDCFQATVALCLLYSYAGQHQLGLRYASTGLRLIQAMGLRPEFVTGAYYTIATAQLAAHDLAAARNTMKTIADSLGQHPTIAFPYAKVLDGELLLLDGKFSAARAKANEIIATPTTPRNARVLGTAFRLRAEAEAALGDARRARDSVDNSIAVLQCGAPLGLLARSYAVSATITRNRRHRATFRELQALSRLPEMKQP